MKVIHTGTTKTFNRTLEKLKKSKAHFFVKTSGTTKKIQYADSKFGMQFLQKKINAAFLCNMVMKDIDKYLKNRSTPNSYRKYYFLQNVNIETIKKNINKKYVAIDINHCYWRTAYNLGFISEKTYNRGMDESVSKESRLVAIGALNKNIRIEEYKDGKVIDKKWDVAHQQKYSPFYWKVIETIYILMCDLQILLGEDMPMYMTDCAYVSEEKSLITKQYLTKNGYLFKEGEITFKSIDEAKREIKFLFKEKNKDIIEKTMNYAGREVSEIRTSNYISSCLYQRKDSTHYYLNDISISMGEGLFGHVVRIKKKYFKEHKPADNYIYSIRLQEPTEISIQNKNIIPKEIMVFKENEIKPIYKIKNHR